MSTTRATGPGSGDWHFQAACRDADPELFFPVGDSVIAQLQTATALQMCAICPVRKRCLRATLEHDQVSGIWGGTTEAERLRPTPADQVRVSDFSRSATRPVT